MSVGVDVFLLVLGFALLKMTIGLWLVRQGMRSTELPGGDEPWDGLDPPREPRPPRGPGRAAVRRRGGFRQRRHDGPQRRPAPRTTA